MLFHDDDAQSALDLCEMLLNVFLVVQVIRVVLRSDPLSFLGGIARREEVSGGGSGVDSALELEEETADLFLEILEVFFDLKVKECGWCQAELAAVPNQYEVYGEKHLQGSLRFIPVPPTIEHINDP